MFDSSKNGRRGGGWAKPPPSPSFLSPIDHPLVEISFSPPPSSASIIQDGGHIFREEVLIQKYACTAG